MNKNNKFVNVKTESGEQRIAGISKNGEWVSVSAGIASLEGREQSTDCTGGQCEGEWLAGQTVTDEVTGEVYRHQNP